MKNTSLFIIFLLSIMPSVCYSQSTDRGKITLFFASGTGSMAIQLDNAFANANLSGECPTASAGGYAGVASTVAPILKSTILAAKSLNSEISVVIDKGSDPEGSPQKSDHNQ